MNLTSWLIAMVGPVVAKILLTLGFSVVSIVGMDVVLDQIKALLLQHLQAVPAAALQVAMLAGVGEALGMLFGAIATKLVLWQMQNAARILGTAPGA